MTDFNDLADHTTRDLFQLAKNQRLPQSRGNLFIRNRISILVRTANQRQEKFIGDKSLCTN